MLAKFLCAPADAQKRIWVLVFDDVDRQPEYFSGYGAERAARNAWRERSRNWNCHLLATVSRVPSMEGG